MYSKTYNFIYLRAKSIFQKEEDAVQLMKEVYMKALEQEIKEDRLYAWLGKQVYTMGCSKFRKRKVREADYIELDQDAYRTEDGVDLEQSVKVICDTMEELPDMYQATLYAFYYDHMTMKEIATAMGYHVGVIINRLNYSHKYFEKALALEESSMTQVLKFNQIVAYEYLGEFDQANVLMRSYLQIYPDDQEALREYEFLRSR